MANKKSQCIVNWSKIHEFFYVVIEKEKILNEWGWFS